ncbi:MAG: EAL domain-containing protein [Betaproteobacteria bacterium]|nr:EAL domain-containing protein [Betaproteobacteria bacterium]
MALTPEVPPSALDPVTARGALTDGDRAMVGQHIHAEQVRLLYRFSLVGYLAELLVTFILGAILWVELANPMLFAWFVAGFIVMLSRYGMYKLFIRANAGPKDLDKWESRFGIGAIVMALLWTAMGTLLLPKDATQQIPVIMLVALLTTGSVAYLAPHKSLFGVTSLLALLPMSLMLALTSGNRTAQLIGGALLVLAILLVMVHNKVHLALLDALSARFDNLLMGMKLEEEKTRVQQANRALAVESDERRKAERAELVALQRLKLHLERTPLGVIEWDMGFKVSTWNPSAEGIFGYSAAEMIGESGHRLVAGDAANDSLASMWSELTQSRGSTRVPLEARNKRGEVIHTEWYNTPLVDDTGKIIGVASLVQDVTERLNTERTIHYMAHHDSLTGLPNRRLMQDRLNQAILAARRQQRYVALLFLDLDRFKLVNDTLGHDTGDFVLRDIARRLSRVVREGDTVSREGGDEFVVVLPDLERPEAAQIVANKILSELAKPIDVAGQEITVTASVGISHYPNDATDVNQLLKHADSAMYQAKDAGRNTVRFFTSDLNFLLSKRLEVESRLRRGIERDEFFLRYQPQVDVISGRVIGVEALLRWNDPNVGEIFPKDFISVAEELGLIVPLGEWVFRTACKQLKAWEKDGFDEISISVNLSPRQFVSRKLLPSMKAAILETGVDAHRIDLEITESMAMRNLDQTIEILSELRQLGCTISVDDFGVGYSSLGQLKRLPAQTLKVDRSFIAQVPDDPNSCSITEAIIAMGKRLKLNIIAEGVEQTSQLDFLRASGCDAFQGYLFAKPLTAGDTTALLKSQRLTTPA